MAKSTGSKTHPVFAVQWYKGIVDLVKNTSKVRDYKLKSTLQLAT